MRPARVRAPTGCGRLAVPAPFGHARPHRAIRRRRAPAHGACGGTRPGLDVRRGQRLPPAPGGDRRSAGLGLRCPLGRCRRRRHVPVLPHTWEGAFTPVADFAETSRSVMLAPGHGMPGEVWRTGRPAWIADAPSIRARCRAPRPPPRRACAPPSPSRSAAPATCSASWSSSPPRAGARRRAAGHDEQPGSQIGQFVERCRAERGVRESEARKTAILNAAFDCIITMDGTGHIVEVNAATEAPSATGAGAGRPRAGGVHDPARRCARTTVAACSATWRPARGGSSGTPSSSRRCAPTAASFPVELAVTRPDLPGPPLFCGYLRDVTERRRAELALQGMAEEQAALRGWRPRWPPRPSPRALFSP